MELWSVIYIIGAAQGAVLAFALLHKQSNQRSSRVLAIWLLLLATDLTLRLIDAHATVPWLAPALVLVQFFPFLHGSMFFLYARSLILQTPFRPVDLMHFAGFIIMTGLNLNWIFNPWENGPRAFEYFDLSLYLYSVSYVVAGIVIIRRYRRALVQQQSTTEGIDLKWLDVMAYGQVVIWSIGVSLWIITRDNYQPTLIYIAVSVWMMVMGYLGLTQQTIQTVRPLKQPVEPPPDERYPEVNERLSQLMQDEKLYRKPALNIGQLASVSGYPEYLISLVINRIHQSTFREYINRLRVEDAVASLLDSTDSRSILDISYDCGFTSKSTFNAAFKRLKNQTPSEFRKQSAAAAEVDADTA